MNKKNIDHNCVDFHKSASVETCASTEATPITTPAGERILKVPVVLAERTVSTNLVANIHFPVLFWKSKILKNG